MSAAPGKKIPDMFFRALKRKAEAVIFEPTVTQGGKKAKIEEPKLCTKYFVCHAEASFYIFAV